MSVPRFPSLAPDQISALKINFFLLRHGSPLAGTGARWVECSNKYQIPYSLAIGIMCHESWFGMMCFRDFNAGGLKSAPEFSSWEQYIDFQFAWLSRYYGHPQVAGDCRGYCEGTPASWLNSVTAYQREVGR